MLRTHARTRIAFLLLATFVVGLAARVAVPVRFTHHAAIGSNKVAAQLQAPAGGASTATSVPAPLKRRCVWRAHHAPLVMLTSLPSLVFIERSVSASPSLAKPATRSPESDVRPPC